MPIFNFTLSKKAAINASFVLILFILLLFSCQNVLASISITNVTSAYGNAYSFSLNHTVPSSSDRLLVVTVGYRAFQANKNISFVSYNGQNLTYLGESNYSSGPGVSAWYLINPPEGENTVNIVLVGQTTAQIAFGVISYSGINQTNPISNVNISSGQSNSAEVFVSSENGDLVEDVMASNANGVPSPGTGQTERWNLEMGGGGSNYAGGSTKTGSSSLKMNWSLPENKPWAILAFNINAYQQPNSAPLIQTNYPDNNSIFSANNVILNVSVYDPEGSNMTLWFFGDSSLINLTGNVMNNSVVLFNWTSLLDGLHFWRAIVGDGNSNTSSSTRFFTIDLINPWDNDPSDISYPQGSQANLGWRLYDNHAPGYYSVLRNGLEQNSTTAWTNNTNLNIWVNTSEIGTWNYTIIYNDSLGHSNSDEVLIIITDNPPYWSNNLLYAPTSYSDSTQSHFNITWNDNSVSTAWLESNFSGAPVNYSMSVYEGNVYTYSKILPAGTFYWKSYANDSLNQWNSSNSWIFTIGKATPPLTLASTPSWNVTYLTGTNITGGNCPGQLSCGLYRNGNPVSNPETITLGYSSYNYTYNTTGNQNYTSYSNSSVLIVNKNTGNCDVLFNETSPLNYSSRFLAYSNCNSNFTLYRNGTAITNNSEQFLAANYYNFTVMRTDIQNYTYYQDTKFFTINKVVTYVSLSLNGDENNLTVEYPGEIIMVYLTNAGTATAYRNGSNVSSENNTMVNLGAGYYNYTVLNPGNENYTGSYRMFFARINKNTGNCDVLFNESSPLTYPSQFKVYSNCNSNFTLYRNGTAIQNNSVQMLGAGAYNFTVFRGDTINYTNTSDNENFIMQKGNGQITLKLNDTEQDISCIYGCQVNASASSSTGTITIYRNGSVIQNNILMQLAAGYYNYTAVANATQNYSSAVITRYARISKIANSLNLTSSAGWGLTYPTGTTLSCGASYGSSKLYKNDVEISNPVNATYGYGTYQIKCNISESENYTSTSTSNTLTINKNSGNCDVLFNETSPLEYPRRFKVYSNCNSNFTLYKNAVPIANNSEQSLTVGSYSFTVQRADNENYTYYQDTEFFTINQNTGNCDVLFNDSSPLTYPSQFRVYSNCNSNFTLYRNGSAIQNNSAQILAAGPYNFTVIRIDTSNYANIFDEENFIMQKGNGQITLKLNDTEQDISCIYGCQVNASASSSTGTITIYRNGSVIQNNILMQLAAGYYNYTAVANATQNYSSASITRYARISKANNLLTLTSTQGWYLIYPTETTLSCSTTHGSSKLYNNGTEILNPTNATYGYGTYQIKCNISESENYTSNTTQNNLIVSTNYDFCNVLFNESSPKDYPSVFRAYTDCSSEYKLYRNGTEIANNSIQNLAANYWNFSIQRMDIENYSNTYDEEFFTINQNSGNCDVLFNDSSPLTYPSQFRVYSNCNSNFTLYRNGSAIQNNSAQILAAGPYNFTVIRNDDENYTNTYDEELFILNKAPISVGLYLNGNLNQNLTINYGASSNATGTSSKGIVQLYRQGTLVSNPEIRTFAANPSGYLYNVNATGNENYSDNSSGLSYYLKVNRVSSVCLLSFSPSNLITYGTSINVSCSCTNLENSAKLFRNGADVTSENYNLVSLGASTYSYLCNVSEGENYSSAFASNALIVNKNNGSCDVLFNDSSPLTYPSQFRVYSNCNSNFTLYRNGTLINNNSTQVLGAGLYNFTVIRNDNENYSNIYDENLFTFNKGSPVLHLYLNGTENNKGYQLNNTINATGTKDIDEGVLELLNNGTVVESTTGNYLEDETYYDSVDYREYTLRFNETENYTSQTITYFATLQEAPPDNFPAVGLDSPEDYYNSTTESVTFYCTGVDDWKLESMTLYGNWSGWHADSTNQDPVNNQSTAFEKTLENGVYVWNCLACDNSSQCIFSANRTLTVSFEEKEGGGGGGGGGGEPPAIEPLPITGDDTLAQQNEDNQGEDSNSQGENEEESKIQISGSKGHTVTINITVSKSKEKEQHTITFVNVTNDSVSLIVFSYPTPVFLKIGESAQVDLDRDGTKDMDIRLLGITEGKADLFIEKLIKATNVCGNKFCEYGENEENCPGDCKSTGIQFVWTWGYWVAIGIVAGLIVFIVIMKRRQMKSARYRYFLDVD